MVGAVEKAVSVYLEMLDVDVGEFPRGEHDNNEGKDDLENVERDAEDGGGFGFGHGGLDVFVVGRSGWEKRLGGVRRGVGFFFFVDDYSMCERINRSGKEEELVVGGWGAGCEAREWSLLQ